MTETKQKTNKNKNSKMEDKTKEIATVSQLNRFKKIKNKLRDKLMVIRE
jgi:hypothetical protein